MSADWNAEEYNQISEPQFRWGLEVLSSLELNGDETVLDAGCGSGRLTKALLERVPKGRVIALDTSDAMLEVARRELSTYGDRVSFVQADLGALQLDKVADVIFSTATLHWVLDHKALFHGLKRALKPGGRLHAQCGGYGNLSEHLALAVRTGGEALQGLSYPTHFATPEEALENMEAAGFVDAKAWLKDAPTPFRDAASYRRFVKHVTLRTVVSFLGDQADTFLDAVTAAAAPAYNLDYVRLELRATVSR
jgi:trans-aconitate 2-methyltransferase